MTAEAARLAEDRPVKRRRAWLALILVFIAPEAAYLYVGRPWRALAVALAWVALLLSMRSGLGGALAEPAGWLALLIFGAGVFLFPIVDAARIAWGERGYRLRGYNRGWLYLVVAVAAHVAALAALDPDLGGFLAVRPFSTPSGSMAPTLNIGDKVVGDMRAYERGDPQPGDVVVFDRDGDGSELWVKRVIAGPGDTVALVHGVVEVNGAAVRLDAVGAADPPERAIETLANGTSHLIMAKPSDLPQANDMEKTTVPADSYFVLGDNRANSADSRFPSVGFVPRARILGRLTFIYWSSDRRRIGATIP